MVNVIYPSAYLSRMIKGKTYPGNNLAEVEYAVIA